MGQGDQDRIQALLGGIQTGETTGTVTGGQFSYDEATLRQIIKNWRELAQSYNDSLRNARPMALISSPADDFASTTFTGKANESGKAYLSYLQHNRDYCLEQAQLFQDALNDYLGTEEQVVIDLNDAADSGPQPGL
ncbi:hypothetical protein [Actinophytocola sp. KF-1]